MYLRESRQKRADGSVLTHLQLAENVWDPDKQRAQVKIIYNCGRADDPASTARLRRLARSILRRCAPDEIVAENPSWQVVNAWPYGDLYVLEQLWRRLGIGEVIAEVCGGRKFDFDVERALFAMMANRACAPASKLYCYEQWLTEEVHLQGTAELKLQHLYRAMDFLEANKDAIEKAIYFRMADLLNLDVEIVFYDTTSLHFEVDEEDRGRGEQDEVHGSPAAGRKTYPALREARPLQERPLRCAADRGRARRHPRWLPGPALDLSGQHGRRHHGRAGQAGPAGLAPQPLRVRRRCRNGIEGEP